MISAIVVNLLDIIINWTFQSPFLRLDFFENGNGIFSLWLQPFAQYNINKSWLFRWMGNLYSNTILNTLRSNIFPQFVDKNLYWNKNFQFLCHFTLSCYNFCLSFIIHSSDKTKCSLEQVFIDTCLFCILIQHNFIGEKWECIFFLLGILSEKFDIVHPSLL